MGTWRRYYWTRISFVVSKSAGAFLTHKCTPARQKKFFAAIINAIRYHLYKARAVYRYWRRLHEQRSRRPLLQVPPKSFATQICWICNYEMSQTTAIHSRQDIPISSERQEPHILQNQLISRYFRQNLPTSLRRFISGWILRRNKVNCSKTFLTQVLTELTKIQYHVDPFI